MSRHHDEADWPKRVAAFVRSPKKVVRVDLERRTETNPETTEPNANTKETSTP